MTRRTDALSIRDRALEALRTFGREEAPHGFPITVLVAGPFSLVLLDTAKLDPSAPYYRALFVTDSDAPEPTGLTLDIWFKGHGKVFGFDWGGMAEPHIRAFKRGPWEKLTFDKRKWDKLLAPLA